MKKLLMFVFLISLPALVQAEGDECTSPYFSYSSEDEGVFVEITLENDSRTVEMKYYSLEGSVLTWFAEDGTLLKLRNATSFDGFTTRLHATLIDPYKQKVIPAFMSCL